MEDSVDFITYKLLELMLEDEKSYDKLVKASRTNNSNISFELKNVISSYGMSTSPRNINVILELVRQSVQQ